MGVCLKSSSCRSLRWVRPTVHPPRCSKLACSAQTTPSFPVLGMTASFLVLLQQPTAEQGYEVVSNPHHFLKCCAGLRLRGHVLDPGRPDMTRRTALAPSSGCFHLHNCDWRFAHYHRQHKSVLQATRNALPKGKTRYLRFPVQSITGHLDRPALCLARELLVSRVVSSLTVASLPQVRLLPMAPLTA